MNKVEKFKYSGAILPFIMVSVLIISGLSLFSYGFYAPEKTSSFKGNVSTLVSVPDYGDATCYDYQCQEKHDMGCSTTYPYCYSSTETNNEYTNVCYQSIYLGQQNQSPTQSVCIEQGGTWNNSLDLCFMGSHTTITSSAACSFDTDGEEYNGKYDWHQTGTSGGHSSCMFANREDISLSPDYLCNALTVGSTPTVTVQNQFVSGPSSVFVCQLSYCSNGTWRNWGDEYICGSDLIGEGYSGNCTHSTTSATRINGSEKSNQCYTYTCSSSTGKYTSTHVPADCGSNIYSSALTLPACTSSNNGSSYQVKANYIVEYVDTIGSGCTEKSVTYDQYGSTIGSLCTPTPPQYYVFDGWYDQATGGSLISPSMIIEQNIQVYAHWTLDAPGLCDTYICQPAIPTNSLCTSQAGANYKYCAFASAYAGHYTNTCYTNYIYASSSSECTSKGGTWYSGAAACFSGQSYDYSSTSSQKCSPVGYSTYAWTKTNTTSYVCTEGDWEYDMSENPSLVGMAINSLAGTCNNGTLWDNVVIKVG